MKIGLLIIAVLLVGCGDHETVETSVGEARPARDDSVFDPMVQTMDQARGVEQLSADRKRELDQEIEASE